VKLGTFASALALLLVPSIAHAWPQARDYFLDPPRAGSFVHADLVTVGAQVSVEKRVALEDESLGMFHMRANAMASLGFADVGVHTDLRVLGMFTFGASAGYRRVWNNYAYPEANTREKRHDKVGREGFTAPADDPGPKAVNWPWFEARARMVIPLESLWLVTNAAVRWESAFGGGGMLDNSFDWFHTNVHDPGRIVRLDATLFYRHPKLGGLGPAVRYMKYKRNGEDVDELVYGLTFGTRPGFRKRDDLLLVQTLFDFQDKDKSFGWHVGPLEKIPAYIMLIYRATFTL
jgi:hypothetical protein